MNEYEIPSPGEYMEDLSQLISEFVDIGDLFSAHDCGFYLRMMNKAVSKSNEYHKQRLEGKR